MSPLLRFFEHAVQKAEGMLVPCARIVVGFFEDCG